MQRFRPLLTRASMVLLTVLLCPAAGKGGERIVLQLRWDHQFQFAGYYAAQWQQYYEGAGLTVEIRSALTPEAELRSTVEEVSAGRADFGIGAADILIAEDAGQSLSVVACVFQQSAARFFLKQDTPFSSLADLAKLRVARRVDDLIDVELQAMLLKEGIDLASVPPHPHQPGHAHLLDDRVQVMPGYLTSAPFYRDQVGRPLKMIRPADYGVDFYGDAIFTTRRFAQSDPALVKRFVEASMRGWRYALEHSEAVATRISRDLDRVDTLVDPQVFNRSQVTAVRKLTLYPIVRLGNINPHRWQRMHTLMRELGQVRNDLDLDQFIFDTNRVAAAKNTFYRRIILGGIGLTALLLGVGLLWLRTLRRTVRQKTIAVRREKNKFRSLSTHAPNIIFATNRNLEVTFLNRTIDGADPATIIGRHIASLTPEDEIEAVLARVETVRRTRQPVQYEIMSKADFCDYWLDVRVGPLLQDGQVNGFIFILTDITERRRAEEALAESERRLATLIGNLPGMAYRCANDPHWTMTFVSEGCLSLTGYAAADLTGNATIAYGQLIHSEDRERVWEEIQASVAAQQPFQLTYRILAADGSQKWVWEQGRGVFSKDETFIALEGFITDISENKEMEEELRQAHKMEAIGTLAGGIAHDFNNILAVIIGFTELALDDVTKETEMAENLQEVHAASLQAKTLVQQILTFARQSEEEKKPIQVDTVAREVLNLIRSSLPSTIEIRTEIDSQALILGNVIHVHQILMNLCSNAAHAMRDKGGRLTIGLGDTHIGSHHPMWAKGLVPGDYVEIQVADQGHGIAPHHMDSIFEPFFTTKDTGEGTGMGLAVVHGIVESCDGKIAVQSTLGEGTLFRLYLPITQKRPAATALDVEAMATGRERILFVDDEEAIVRMGGRLLTRLGYRVTTRTSSVEALALFRANPQQFDLVITDMTMPTLAGDDLAVQMMAMRPEIPIILCTGYSHKISEARAHSIGIKAFAFKPIVKTELARTVRKVLDATQ